jgi:transcriptional regulator with XRE-family HTH domain
MTSQPTPITIPSGDVLRALRVGAELSLRALADLLSADGRGTVTHGHLGRVETGERIASQELANRIATAVGHHLSGRDAA